VAGHNKHLAGPMPCCRCTSGNEYTSHAFSQSKLNVFGQDNTLIFVTGFGNPPSKDFEKYKFEIFKS